MRGLEQVLIPAKGGNVPRPRRRCRWQPESAWVSRSRKRIDRTEQGLRTRMRLRRDQCLRRDRACRSRRRGASARGLRTPSERRRGARASCWRRYLGAHEASTIKCGVIEGLNDGSRLFRLCSLDSGVGRGRWRSASCPGRIPHDSRWTRSRESVKTAAMNFAVHEMRPLSPWVRYR
jgi:hypothetical protein